jgi:indolepyruvate ferredoxin oxidoreductase beta subunit
MMDIVLCGVGGQGVLLASEVLAQAALRGGFDVKKSEVHGMAQRGGSVVSHVRYAEKVRSPLIAEGTADVVLALEQLEALRYAHMVSPDGWVVVNELQLAPSGVLTGDESYPAHPLRDLRRRLRNVCVVPCREMAEALGNPRVQNVIALGALSTLVDIEPVRWKAALRALVKPRYLSVNLKAFRMGRGAVPV